MTQATATIPEKVEIPNPQHQQVVKTETTETVVEKTIEPVVEKQPVVSEQDMFDGLTEKTKNRRPVKEVEKPVETPTETIEEKPIEKTADASTSSETVVDPKVDAKNKLNTDLGITKAPAAVIEADKPVLPKDVQSRLDYLEGLMKDPSIAAVVAAKKQNKDIFQVTDELRGVDPDKMPVDELFKIKLDRLGITETGEIEDELLAFGQKTKSEKLESVMAIREQLRSERDLKLKDFIATTDQNSKQTESLYASTINGYAETLNSKVGTKVYGVVITPEMASDLQEITVWAQNGQQPVSSQELFELNLLHKYGKNLIIPTIIENSFAAGEEFVNNKTTVTGSEKVQQKSNIAIEPTAKGSPKRLLENIQELAKAEA